MRTEGFEEKTIWELTTVINQFLEDNQNLDVRDIKYNTLLMNNGNREIIHSALVIFV